MWLDNASEVDILFYEPYANVIADISKNPSYKPLTIGVFGVWGAGKSTLLKLIEQKIDVDSEKKGKTLCININAWTFEGYEDAKIALMEALLREIKEHKDIPSKVKDGVSKLLKKLDFFKLATKAASVGAPVIASVATGNPIPLLLSVTGKAEEVGDGIKNVANAMQSIRDDYLKDEESDDTNSIVNNVRKFRKEFKETLKDDGIENVIVLIDDLDRCQPDRIIETLEAIKLFLSVEKMTFIIAADENVIQYAIRKKYPPIENYSVNLDKEYIEKIIQLPIYIPELSSKDIENYLMLLVVQEYCNIDQFKEFLKKIKEEKMLISNDVIDVQKSKRQISPAKKLPDTAQGVRQKIKICPLLGPHQGTRPRHRQLRPGMPHPSSRSRRNRCVQLCLRTSVPGVDVPVRIQESNQSHTRNNPGRNLPGSCRRWQNRLRNSQEKHRAF